MANFQIPSVGSSSWGPVLNGSLQYLKDASDAVAYSTTTTDNGPLSVSEVTDANGVRSWLETGADMGPTSYATARLAPEIIKYLGAEAVRPTGNANDDVAINAALVRSSAVVLSGSYRLSAPIQVPSHRTLILQDAIVVLEPGLTCNILTNSNLAVKGNVGIRVIGIGRAVLDGNGINQVRSSTESWRNVGVHWVGVQNFQVTGITIRNTSNFSALHVGCYQGSWTNITLDQDRSVANQDGIDFGPGNSYIYVDGVYGRVEDDCFSIFAKYSTGGGSVHPAFSTGGDTHHLYISNVFLDTYRSLFRLQAAEGSALHHIYASNVNHTGPNRCQTFLNLGELKAAYVSGSYPDASGNDFYAIYMNGLSGRTHAMLRMSSNVKDVYLSDLSSDNWGYIVTTNDADTGAGFNINLDGVYTSYSGAGSYGAIVEVDQPNHSITGLSITNMNIARADRVTFSAQPVTAGKLQGVIGQVDTRVFSGATNFVGEVDLTIKTSGYTAGTTPALPSPAPSHIKNF